MSPLYKKYLVYVKAAPFVVLMPLFAQATPPACDDLNAWQIYLNGSANDVSQASQILDHANECSNRWGPAVNSCFDNLRRHQRSSEEFKNAGRRQEEYFGDRWKELTDMSDIFDCRMTSVPAGQLKVCRPPRNWATTYANCIRNPDSEENKANPLCQRVEGWCAFEMRRHHEGYMDTRSWIVLYNPSRNRFIINTPSNQSGTERDSVAETLTVVPPSKPNEPWRGVYSTFEGGLMIPPNNTASANGCWHCHFDGAPRKISPLWGSVFSQDQKGVQCMNSAIEKMGTFSADHLWNPRNLDPGRGEGHPRQSCTECHSSDPKRAEFGYQQRGRLLHNPQMTREIFAKMTSWNPSMPMNAHSNIPQFQRAMQILNRINEVDDNLGNRAFNRYVETYRRLADKIGGQMLEFPDRDLKKAEQLLAAHRDAKVAALYTLGVSAVQIELVRRVMSEVDRRGLEEFRVMTSVDQERLRKYLGGGRENCLLSREPNHLHHDSAPIER